ncbi:hypothetical protein EGT07_23795 [Herbaspirillum sp. HC18]|nr:hypothetical protein EGT07_23795 [Herbaspirillum sp. HC18]
MQAFEAAVERRDFEQDGSFDRLVASGRILPAEVVARFDCPDLDDPRMLWGSAEFFRWYMADGTKRERPLDYDELVEFIAMRDRCSNLEAEREVCLNSLARKGDQEVWSRIVELGYVELTRFFAEEEYGPSLAPEFAESH